METKAVGIRIPVELLEKVKEHAQKRKLTFNQIMNLAAKEIIRSHTKKL